MRLKCRWLYFSSDFSCWDDIIIALLHFLSQIWRSNMLSKLYTARDNKSRSPHNLSVWFSKLTTFGKPMQGVIKETSVTHTMEKRHCFCHVQGSQPLSISTNDDGALPSENFIESGTSLISPFICLFVDMTLVNSIDLSSNSLPAFVAFVVEKMFWTFYKILWRRVHEENSMQNSE